MIKIVIDVNLLAVFIGSTNAPNSYGRKHQVLFSYAEADTQISVPSRSVIRQEIYQLVIDVKGIINPYNPLTFTKLYK